MPPTLPELDSSSAGDDSPTPVHSNSCTPQIAPGKVPPSPSPRKAQTELASRRWIDTGTVFPILQDPKQYSMHVKIVILCVVSIITLAAPFCSNAFLPAFDIMLATMDATKTEVN
ncbi:hypothetical protein DACRYDRAFT_108894 [Dacryopinax primogenitus]|uniref:Uncharacterized protein n=1 Tax=Dacryopinax primogenitus (strain DJM 731) TaxID=1858805 RepID=M5FTA3_DACPD|nr:uncharacterized protein DACRYDRAFT_108894 [Dacryopinax primogenitus]EJU00841.1 hypothetical protein DACRYDRAFT_108894 [Dacryopinax primogenitus]